MVTTKILTAAVLVATTLSAQQRGPAPDPLVKENATVKVAAHTYVIPDGNVPLVPNVGIVVGSRATLVVDPGLGRRNGETVLREVAKVSKNTELYIATHAFPSRAHDRLRCVSGEREVHQLDGPGSRVRAERHADGADVLRPIGGDGRDPEGRRAAPGSDHVRSRVHARSRRRPRALHRRRSDAHARRHRAFSSKATTCCSPATSS